MPSSFVLEKGNIKTSGWAHSRAVEVWESGSGVWSGRPGSSVLADPGLLTLHPGSVSLAVKSSYFHILLAGVLLSNVVPLVGISRYLLLTGLVWFWNLMM